MFSKNLINKIENAFNRRFNLLPMPENLNEVLITLSDEQRVCLKYYYAFMPQSDMVSYDSDLYLQIINQALKVWKENMFNEKIPEEIFLNFVLQYRINNENLEHNRGIFYDELYQRVKGKSAEEAVLEINYWCLEKVTYIGNDMRTMSPLTLIKNTMGRCGEESTFTVCALRSMGIPARQIYTPRWAHCESNHAWVEAYVNGKWRFIGACEPEPALDKGWFTGPASKGMLIYARQFSNFKPENEEVAFSSDLSCEINRTEFYVQNSLKFKVKIKNHNKNVKVHLQVVSSCSFYPIISVEPNENGEVAVTIGAGDIYVYVTDGECLITAKVDTKTINSVILDFAKATKKEEKNVSYIFSPPFSDYKDPDYNLTEEDIKAHEAKTARCHDIRNSYFATFANEEEGKEIAEAFVPNHFDGSKYFVDARGNLDEVIKFMEKPYQAKHKYMMLRSSLSKDLTDCEAGILEDHLIHALPFENSFFEEIFEKYVLSPRVEFEMIVSYRSFILGYFTDEQKQMFLANPKSIWDWIQENIKNTVEYRTANDHRFLCATPVGLLTHKFGGNQGRKLLFVQICRTLGIPARLNPQDTAPEYYVSGDFVKVVLEEVRKTVNLKITDKNNQPVNYFESFTLSKFENGYYNTLFFGYGEEINDYNIEPGDYLLMTGRRLDDGSMSVKMIYETINEDRAITVEIPMPIKSETSVEIKDFKFGKTNLSSMLSGKDLVACINPSHEPTEHLFKELLDARDVYAEKNVKLVLVTAKENASLKKVVSAFKDDVTVIKVKDEEFVSQVASDLGINGVNLPLVTSVRSENDLMHVCYFSQGYHVGSALLALECFS